MLDMAGSASLVLLFSYLDFRVFFCLLSSRILQNNLLDLYSVIIQAFMIDMIILRKTRNRIRISKKSVHEANNRPATGASHMIGHCLLPRIQNLAHRAQSLEGRLALNPGLNLTLASFSCFQKHFLG